MMVTVDRTIDVHYSLEFGFSFIQLFSHGRKIAEFVQSFSDLGMHSTVGTLLYREGPLQHGGGLIIFFLINEGSSQGRQYCRSFGTAVSVISLRDLERLPSEFFGFAVITQIELDR